MIDGSFQHRDSSGAKGELGPGDAQYMVAGRGVVHAEMPSETIMKEGGTVEGFQLWINLPSKKKMMEASYQDVPATAMPILPLVTEAARTDPKKESTDTPSLPSAGPAAGSSDEKSPPPPSSPRQQGSAKVVLGSTLGATGPIKLETAVTYVDLRLRPGSAIDVDIPKGQEGFVYAFRGKGTVGASHGSAKAAAVEEGVMAQLGKEGGAVRVSCPGASHDGAPAVGELLVPGELKEDAGGDGTAAPRREEVPLDEAGLAVLIVTGEPIGEPVVKYGPFVMNTQEEIVQAMRDYHSGRLGGAIEGAEERMRRTQEAKAKQQRSGTWKDGDREL